MELEKSIHNNELFDLYGTLLSVGQQKIMKLYLYLNLSLSEIGEELKISRNAVFDAIKKATMALEKYEEKLGLLKRNKEILEALDELEKSSSKKDKELINKIREKV